MRSLYKKQHDAGVQRFLIPWPGIAADADADEEFFETEADVSGCVEQGVPEGGIQTSYSSHKLFYHPLHAEHSCCMDLN